MIWLRSLLTMIEKILRFIRHTVPHMVYALQLKRLLLFKKEPNEAFKFRHSLSGTFELWFRHNSHNNYNRISPQRLIIIIFISFATFHMISSVRRVKWCWTLRNISLFLLWFRWTTLTLSVLTSLLLRLTRFQALNRTLSKHDFFITCERVRAHCPTKYDERIQLDEQRNYVHYNTLRLLLIELFFDFNAYFYHKIR